MRFKNVIWFNSVGIVQVEDEFDGIKYYIKDVAGNDERIDIEDIMKWGSKFPKTAGDVLFTEMGY